MVGHGTTALTETNIDELTLKSRGKVRDIYEVDDRLLIVATDRVSAFDVVLPNGVPMKGQVLTALSRFWFGTLESATPNHLVTTDIDTMPAPIPAHHELAGRTMLARKANVFPVECVVRGYLAGSGWKDYQATGAVCGIPLPEGLQKGAKLPEPIFTPATKAESGHDENISFERMCEIIGTETAEALRTRSIEIYNEAQKVAEAKGIIICDTKFEFGEYKGDILLVDEVLTPDSSRFWPAESMKEGVEPIALDKQFVRDYLETLDWDKTPPGPELPEEVVNQTTQRYLDVYEMLVGSTLE